MNMNKTNTDGTGFSILCRSLMAGMCLEINSELRSIGHPQRVDFKGSSLILKAGESYDSNDIAILTVSDKHEALAVVKAICEALTALKLGE